jgi:hypothetical protein
MTKPDPKGICKALFGPAQGIMSQINRVLRKPFSRVALSIQEAAKSDTTHPAPKTARTSPGFAVVAK